MVVLMSRCPAMSWAMCGGRPFMIASVMKILRKSCGVKRSGLAAGVGQAGAASALVEELADRVRR